MGIRLLPIPPSRPSHCQLSRRTTAESPRMTYIIPCVGSRKQYMYTTTHGRVQYTYREHLPLSCLLTVFGSCEVSKVKDKRQINALFHKSHTHPLSPLGFLRKNAFAKIINISEIHTLIFVFLCIFAKKKLNIYKSRCYDQLS